MDVVEAGRKGGKARLEKMTAEERRRVANLGVKARLQKMTPEQRRRIARRAAKARWAQQKTQIETSVQEISKSAETLLSAGKKHAAKRK